MKVLLVGCTGFIGRSLVRQLVKNGHDCTVLIRSHRSAVLLRYPDAARLTPYNERPEDCDAVINLAGEPIAGGWTPKKKKAILDSRIDTAKELVDWMRTLPKCPSVFLSASAVGFYGSRGIEPLSEESGPDPTRGFLSQVCILWEQEANHARMSNIRVVNLRIGNVLDPTGGFLARIVPLLRMFPVIMPIAPHAFVPWISLRDAVGIIEFAMLHESVKGPVNLVAPVPSTSRELYGAIAAVIRRPIAGKTPKWFIKAALGEFSEVILASQKVLPTKASFEGYVFQDPDLLEFLRRRYSEFQKDRRSRPVKKRSKG